MRHKNLLGGTKEVERRGRVEEGGVDRKGEGGVREREEEGKGRRKGE